MIRKLRTSPVLREARATLRLALPIAFGSASQILMGVLDSVMIGRVGAVPLAASAFAGSVFGFFLLAGIGLLLPVAILVSRSHGAGRPTECASWLTHGLTLALAAGGGAALLMAGLSTRLGLFGQPAEVVAIVRPFFLLIAASILPALLFQILRQYAESLGMPLVPMVIMVCCVCLNALLNWTLIYGHLGAPALGLTGAGIGTLVARTTALGSLFFVLRKRLRHAPEWPWSRVTRSQSPGYTRSRFAELLRLGVPSAGQLLFELCAFSASAIMMGWLGTRALAAHQIALSCGSLTFMFPLGVATAASMRLGRALGEGDRERLRPIGLGAFGLAWVAMGTFALVFALFGTQIARGFIEDPAVVALAAHLLIVAAVFQIFDGTQVVGTGSLRGLSDVRVPTLITGFSYCGIAIPVSYFLGVRGIGPIGVWGGLAAGLACAAILLFRRFTRLTGALAHGA
ncbi:multidrug resistance protein NorM [mine drainage metagenome]|uniref:Multidrug-efflux transporter n=1 Tax=mine drainage metagenome TaxID=410659 RepID=A0A1J5SM58_9ZZZZ